MVVRLRIIVEKRDKYQAVRQKAACNEGVGKLIIAHVVIV